MNSAPTVALQNLLLPAVQAPFCPCHEEKRLLLSIPGRLVYIELHFVIIASPFVSRSSSDRRKGYAWAQPPDYFADDFQD